MSKVFIEKFKGSNGRWYARAVASNGNELIRTSEGDGYTRPGRAIDALLAIRYAKGAALPHGAAGEAEADVKAQSVVQPWTFELSMMQQSVLLTAVRGPDGIPKYNAVKFLVRWYRRCILLSAMMRTVVDEPYSEDGGSFLGPSFQIEDPPADRTFTWELAMDNIVARYLQELDALPHHWHMHFVHCVEILGYKHPDARIRAWWRKLYLRFVRDLYMQPESEKEMDERLGDDRQKWLERSDPATTA